MLYMQLSANITMSVRDMVYELEKTYGHLPIMMPLMEEFHRWENTNQKWCSELDDAPQFKIIEARLNIIMCVAICEIARTNDPSAAEIIPVNINFEAIMQQLPGGTYEGLFKSTGSLLKVYAEL